MRKMRIAKQEANIEHARMVVHSSLGKSTWETFGITGNTPRTKINSMDFPDQADYTIEGNVDFNGKNVPFAFEVQIGGNHLPNALILYPTNGEIIKAHLQSASDVQADNAGLQNENERKISRLLMEVQQRLG